MKNAASRPGHVGCVLRSNFKQPSFLILAAQCVRGLPVPREPREGMERREAPGHQRAPLEAGLTYPPRAARLPRAPSDVGRGASRRSTLATSLSTVPGRPGPASFRSVQRRVASRKRSLLGQDGSDNKPALGDGDKECENFFVSVYKAMCPGRSAAWSTCGTVRCRAGAVPSAGVWYGPGSAKQRFARATRCIAPGTRTSHLPFDHHHLEFGDRLGGVEALRAGFGAVHDGVAAVEPERVFEIVEPLAGGLVAGILDPARRLQ